MGRKDARVRKVGIRGESVRSARKHASAVEDLQLVLCTTRRPAERTDVDEPVVVVLVVVILIALRGEPERHC
jgi:hypothetical protein